MGLFVRSFWTLAAGGLAYICAIFALTYPSVQRNAMYAHRVNPTIYQNLSNVDQFGFIHHQVQPFTVTTPDNATLFAWHILPTHLYRRHEQELKAQKEFGLKPFHAAAGDLGLQLLLNDPTAHVVVVFHGNAGHIASSYRPQTYRQFLGTSTPEKPVHVIAFDYRGFGLSTGSPTEQGVILDATTVLQNLVEWREHQAITPQSKLDTGHVFSPSQIILTGQSMGTFVSTAVYHKWTLGLHKEAFKGLILFASFSSLTALLESYSIKGFSPPLLSPISGYPWLQRWFLSKIVDKWDTASRLQEILRTPELKLDLTIMHARDDWEIAWWEGRRNWLAVTNAVNETGILSTDPNSDRNTEVCTWISDDYTKRVKWEQINHGGHNQIPVSEQAKLALLDLLDR